MQLLPDAAVRALHILKTPQNIVALYSLQTSQLIHLCSLFQSWQSPELNERRWHFTSSFCTDSPMPSHNSHSLSRLYDLHLYWWDERMIDAVVVAAAAAWTQSDKLTYWVIWVPFGLPSQAETKTTFFFYFYFARCSDEGSSWRLGSMIMISQQPLGGYQYEKEQGLLKSFALSNIADPNQKMVLRLVTQHLNQ